MQDSDLECYLLKHGDRFATKRFCKNINSGASDQEKRKSTLLERLRRKMKTRHTERDADDVDGDDEDTSEGRVSRKLRGNINAKKEKRRIVVGWIVIKNGKSKQVRMQNGGGTRKLTMDRDATGEDILLEAKRLFFPGGKSPRGQEREFEFELWDFAENKIPAKNTINDIYESTKVGIVRVYLASIQNQTHTDDDSLPDLDQSNNTSSTTQSSSTSDDIKADAARAAGVTPADDGDSGREPPMVAATSHTMLLYQRTSWT